MSATELLEAPAETTDHVTHHVVCCRVPLGVVTKAKAFCGIVMEDVCKGQHEVGINCVVCADLDRTNLCPDGGVCRGRR
jgi:hypothetical protein